MLLPSTFPAGPRPRLQRFGAYSHEGDSAPRLTSPPSTPLTPQGIDGTCHALQSALGTWRSPKRKGTNQALHAGARVLKRPPPRTRGYLKRRREEGESEQDDDDSEMDLGSGNQSEENQAIAKTGSAPSTPKRRRRLPTSVPFGLERADLLHIDRSCDADTQMSFDEGIDSSMSEALSSDIIFPPPLDEGYGSMDMQVPKSTEDGAPIFSPSKALPTFPHVLGTFLFGPPPANLHSEPTSMGTPASDMAAMALSPQNLDAISNTGLPRTPEIVAGRGMQSFLPPPVVRDSPPLALDQDELPQLPDADYDVDAPSQSRNRNQCLGYFRPRPGRKPSHVHSDPVDYDLGSDSPPGLVEDSGGGSSGSNASSGSVADHTHRSNTTSTSTSSRHRPHHKSLPSHPALSSRVVYDWTYADDRALVDVVIDKMRLKRGDWDDCARLLGADTGSGASLGRRWRELVGDGCVGLKFRFSGVGFTAEDMEVEEGRSGKSGRGKVRRGRARRGDVRSVDWS